MSAPTEPFEREPVKLNHLLSVAGVARFLGTPEEKVNKLLEEGRLGGALVTAFRNKGVAVTPRLKNSIESVVAALGPRAPAGASALDRAHLLTAEATITIMFTDIVGSTALVERLGDRRAREIFRTHNEIVRRYTRANGGAEVKNMGDGFMLTFNSARRGVACAVEVQRELRNLGMDNPDAGAALEVRMGLSVGEPIREEEDLFGKSVILAARVSAQAQGRQILVCPIVHALVSSTGEFALAKVGDFELKGISSPQTLYEVLWR